MKNSTSTTSYLLLILGCFCLVACSRPLLNVKNQTYKNYSRNNEKGYIVSFELNNPNIIPKSIVINGIVQQIYSTNKTGTIYEINVIAQTSLINGYQVNLEEKENGIYFEKDSRLFFQAVKFKLIAN